MTSTEQLVNLHLTNPGQRRDTFSCQAINRGLGSEPCRPGSQVLSDSSRNSQPITSTVSPGFDRHLSPRGREFLHVLDRAAVCPKRGQLSTRAVPSPPASQFETT
ncbi:hypothetical protein SKAU_G00315100 [Synaphobranchus kaupii]|uniref:Uncharacterized protein n=1 Tax=Synaphobranchus kaupii TaxID=118154 RepID=A0A9Q1ESF0_SYNKA|nr:hypothetical protein SKAU_G00315100 [Synaphobranchus kaupii]